MKIRVRVQVLAVLVAALAFVVYGFGIVGAQQPARAARALGVAIPSPTPTPAGGPAGFQPDIVVFFGDDIGRADVDQLRLAGEAPALTALAAQGTEFRRFQGQPQCSVARVALMFSEWRGTSASALSSSVESTGGFACADGDVGPTVDTLAFDRAALASSLKAAGYRTALFGRLALGTIEDANAGEEDYAHLAARLGFDTWRAGVPDGVASCVPSPGVGGYSSWVRVDDGDVSISTEYQTDALVAEFLAWWDATPSPKFALVSTQAAHKGGPLDEWHVPPPSALPPGTVIPPSPNARARYLLMVRSFDYLVARCMVAVDLPTTLVVVTADNGTPREVKPPGYTIEQVKFSAYEGGVGVPGFVAGLGFPAGMVSPQPVSVVDLAPTLCELAGAVLSPTYDGQSFLPALLGEQLARDWSYVRKPDQAGVDRAATARRAWGGILGGEPRTLKLLEAAGAGVAGQVIFDLDADPFEDHPIPAATPGAEDVVAALRAIMAEAEAQ